MLRIELIGTVSAITQGGDARGQRSIDRIHAKSHMDNVWTDLAQPWVSGCRRNLVVRDLWMYVDIDAVQHAEQRP